MSKGNKFGTFEGVFTPSLLTILGVIMYMRLGWVVGSAGLYYALAIVIIAHIISLSTSLSISSIATDKRIRTGGIYYILSRSLGLPMGGSIGITLFVGTALSISLYIIGFAESFLSLDIIREITGLGQDVVSYQILGSAILIFLTAVALISTSLALKVQFYILAAIFISIISICAGVWMNFDALKFEPILTAAKDAPSMELIFGIFFPAVTGFTAGVAMSGDLDDPKKSIPSGTLFSVLTGLVVYIALTIVFALFVSRDTLINNSNFITEISAVGILVYLGIWGATLSSALGGILGAPRIMQAIAQDKIAPQILAKGKGSDNEPQNALILTFLISEAGILLGGDINAIAAVVSMFYLASYAFINIAFTLEKWASTDFRPSFSIPAFIGPLGAIFAFVVMFQLDMVSMAMALTIMWGIYFLLRRKEIKLEKGDVWQSVWSSVIRTALHRMDKQEIEERNWQPNIILFSGGSSKRPHLIEFGKVLVGKYGMLSNFDLHESTGEKILFPKHQQKVLDEVQVPGVFTRRQSCSDIYQGIEMISRTYGFSGVEPNTVLMGWGRTAKDPQQFVNMIHTLSELDFNILMLDYDKRYGFGEYKQVDIWWRGLGLHGNLSLNLTRFIRSSMVWRDATVRLMIVNPANENSEAIYREALDVVDLMRINAEVKIINNEIEQKEFYDIVRAESQETDLIVIGIPEIKKGNENVFVEETSKLMEDLGTVLLVKASSLFKSLVFGHLAETEEQPIFEADTHENIEQISVDTDLLPKNKQLADSILSLDNELSLLGENFYQQHFSQVFGQHEQFIKQVEKIIQEALTRVEQRSLELPHEQRMKHIRRQQNTFLMKSRKLVRSYIDKTLAQEHEEFTKGLDTFLVQFDKVLTASPQYVYESYNLDGLDRAYAENKNLKTWWFVQKLQLKIQVTGRPAEYSVEFRKLATQQLSPKVYAALHESFHKFGMANLLIYIQQMRLLRSVRNSLMLFEKKAELKELDLDLIKTERTTIEAEFTAMKEQFNDMKTKMPTTSLLGFVMATGELAQNLQTLNPNQNKLPKKALKLHEQTRDKLKQLPDIWHDNQDLLFQSGEFELKMLNLDNITRSSIHKIKVEVSRIYDEYLLLKLNELFTYLTELLVTVEKGEEYKFNTDEIDFSQANDTLWLNLKVFYEAAIKEIEMDIEKFPKAQRMIGGESFNNYYRDQFEGLTNIEVAVYRLLHYIIDEKLSDPLQNYMTRLPNRLQRSVNKATDIIRYISFSLQDSESEQTLDTEENFAQLVKEQIKKVETLLHKITQEKQEASFQMESIMRSVSTQLNIYTFTKSSDKLQQYIKGTNIKSRFLGFASKRVKERVQKVGEVFNQIWFRQSEALLLAQNFQNEKLPNTAVNKLLNMVEESSPNTKVFTQLPFFYQQLFLRTTTDSNEFWQYREKELNETEKAINRFRQNYSGGILIVGERGSGKSSLALQVANTQMSDKTIYNVLPPEEGSTSLSVFRKTIQNALMFRGNYQHMFNNLPPESVVVFDDFELWWEKSDSGMSLVYELAKIIEEHGQHILFLVTMNQHAYKLITQIFPFGNYFLSLIECSSFTAQQLFSVIMQRHGSTGISLNFRNREEKHLSNFNYANLFTKYFSVSEGNIGVALQTWISNISQFKDNTISIEMPEDVSVSALNEIDKSSYIILVQFVLHKQLSIERLQRIMLENEDVIGTRVNYLKRSGILQERNTKVLTINRFIYPIILTRLVEMELL